MSIKSKSELQALAEWFLNYLGIDATVKAPDREPNHDNHKPDASSH
jgi:hypothetical protein